MKINEKIPIPALTARLESRVVGLENRKTIRIMGNKIDNVAYFV
jgi:hypothetical protein